jgi:hypothetical protein
MRSVSVWPCVESMMYNYGTRLFCKGEVVVYSTLSFISLARRPPLDSFANRISVWILSCWSSTARVTYPSCRMVHLSFSLWFGVSVLRGEVVRLSL